jgi:hypothetical protein
MAFIGIESNSKKSAGGSEKQGLEIQLSDREEKANMIVARCGPEDMPRFVR